ncbi:MAG TPA: ABC transporter ATP-binding protein [Terrimicrobiaceae bacterium]
MAKPIIEVRGITKRYQLGEIGALSLRDAVGNGLRRLIGQRDECPQRGEFWALNGVTFDVQPGEIIGLVGKNGAGKSTLLKILSRITEPTSGEAILRGRLASLLEVGTGFHAELSGRENVFLNGAILGMTRKEVARKFDEIVDFAEIEKFIDTPVKRYSSGMYVRLAFAVAAHLEPEILIIDEVLAVGDAEFQKKCISRMETISVRDQRTILFVSHNITAVRRLCSKCVVMTSGRASDVLPVDEAVEIYTQDQKVSARSVDLADHPRHSKQGRIARILRMAVATSSGQLRYGEPGAIDVTFKLTESLKQVMIGIGFDTMEGQRLLTLDSDTMGHAVDFQAGTHRVRVGLPVWPLHPANYSVNVAIITGHNCHDSIGNAAVWEVQTSPLDNVSDRGFGGVRPKSLVETFPG